jgi:hypothetical protein
MLSENVPISYEITYVYDNIMLSNKLVSDNMLSNNLMLSNNMRRFLVTCGNYFSWKLNTLQCFYERKPIGTETNEKKVFHSIRAIFQFEA